MKNLANSDSRVDRLVKCAGFGILAIIILCWTIRLNGLPGLHGDEAWFGLKAIEYLQDGKISSHGMNNYTGSLQSIGAMISFKQFGITVFSLRLFGVICNILALVLSGYYLKKIASTQFALIFLLCLGQSFLLLSYPRIAWEVTSLNFLLMSLYGISLFKLFENKSASLFLWIVLNLMAGFIGSYNHILFSSLLIACLLGLTLDYLLTKGRPIIPLAVVSAGLVNYSSYFFFLNDTIQAKSYGNLRYVALLFIVLICSEAYLIKKSEKIFTNFSNWAFSSKIRNILGGILRFTVAGGTIAFFYFHGLALIQILAGEVVLRRVWIYKMGHPLELYQLGLSAILVFVLVIKVLNDVINKKNVLSSYIITSYLAVFTVYITHDAPRYYLIIVILFYLTLIKVVFETKLRNVFIALMLINFAVNQVIFWNACDYQQKYIPPEIKIGNSPNSKATHFLPMQPVIDTLRKYKIGSVVSSERFFIMQPIYFYQHVYPEFMNFSKKATIEYDYHGDTKAGFIISKESGGN